MTHQRRIRLWSVLTLLLWPTVIGGLWAWRRRQQAVEDYECSRMMERLTNEVLMEAGQKHRDALIASYRYWHPMQVMPRDGAVN